MTTQDEKGRDPGTGQAGRTGQKMDKKKKFEDFLKAQRERNVAMAQEDRAFVTFVHTQDTRPLLFLQRKFDMNIRRVRERVLFTPGVDYEKVKGLLDRYYESIRGLSDLCREISEITGIPYRPPRQLAFLLGDDGDGNAGSDHAPAAGEAAAEAAGTGTAAGKTVKKK
jgi:hypothetical protein